jgi:prepilin-type N-terminal cleavage/methylation domain-containing protein
MLAKLKKPNNRGFTIIEVMIVLAIAGLILLIVFLAVPALQRNARNTQIKNDAGALAGGISTYESDQNGTPPTVINGTGSVTIATGTTAAPTNPEVTKVNAATKVTVVTTQPTTTTFTTTGAIEVLAGTTCSGTTSTRAFSLWYLTETSGSPTLQCLDS